MKHRGGWSRWASSLAVAVLASISTWAATAHHAHPGKRLGAICDEPSDCESGFCSAGLCCNKACNGSCQTCEAAKGAPADGLCVVSPEATPGECPPYACQGPTCPTSCDNDTQCLRGGHCGPDHACRARQPNGSQCADDAACASGHCTDGVCCSSACNGSCEVCSSIMGAEEDGICTLVSGAGAPPCDPYLCDGLSPSCPTSCASAAQCVQGDVCEQGHCQPKGALGSSCGADVDCVDGRCVDGRCVAKPRATGGACTAASECKSGFCADGVCCDSACNGGCDRCDMPNAFGHCRAEKVGAPGSPSCAPYVCGGPKACPTSCVSDKNCVEGDVCASHQCLPKIASGSTCHRDAECESGFCVDGICCGSACDGNCESCRSDGTCAPSPAGTSSQACGAYLCSGIGSDCPSACSGDASCADGDFCSNGQCIAKRGLGVACDASVHCASGQCVDGVCCNSACDGACDACNVPGSHGRCRPVKVGTPGNPSCGAFVCDGHDATCPASCITDRGCAAGYSCNNGQCVPKAMNGTVCSGNTTCASGFCVDGVCCDRACDGACETCSSGTCSPFASGTIAKECGAYLCSGTDGYCPDSCSSDAQCIAGDFCDRGHCAKKKAPGGLCSDADGCTSGFCVDGVCCNTSCDGECAACNLPGKHGQCLPVKGKPVGKRVACGGDGSSCNGRCDGHNPDACTYPASGIACAPAGCDNGNSHGPAICDGAGKCTSATSVSCNGFACQGPQCRTSCATDKGCEDGFRCQDGACVAKQANGTACQDDDACSSGACADGVCCDTSCEGACDRCDLTGHAGVCSPAPVGAMPTENACAAYRCDGMSTTCPGRCNNPAECATGYTCDKGRCVHRRANAAPCKRDDQCGSLHCVGGICCDTACQGTCATCDAQDREGTCTFLSGTSKTDRGQCSGSGACGGVCDGSGPDCSYPDARTQCGTAACSNAVATDPSICDGHGSCAPGKTHDCPTGCDGPRCGNGALRTDDTGCAQTPIAWIALLLLLPRLFTGRRRSTPRAG